jgi:hypothetical protein
MPGPLPPVAFAALLRIAQAAARHKPPERPKPKVALDSTIPDADTLTGQAVIFAYVPRLKLQTE